MPDFIPFSGSYLPEDVHFLLRPVTIAMTPVSQKEQLIQSGEKHYSEMLSQEPEPTSWHLDLFAKALDNGATRLAEEVLMLAKALVNHFGHKPIVLVSLVRAGVPLGVMLQQTLREMGHLSHHYGVSIIRDRGLDRAAMDWIERRHGTEGVVFVDGWTGKGAITQELRRSLASRPGYPINPRLVVLADPCGVSWLAASHDDWLIPFGIMGAPVSGLISRSIWSSEGLHGCVQCEHLRPFECSRQLVDTVARCRNGLDRQALSPSQRTSAQGIALKLQSEQVIESLASQYDIANINRIKPGIAEATRAVLRRVPEHVLVRSVQDPDVALLVYLAREKNITITEVGDSLGQYRAITMIKKVH